MDKNEIIKIIMDAAPESGSDTKFLSYGRLWQDQWGGDIDHAPECVSIINDDIDLSVRDELYTAHNIAVQLDAVREGVRGIRIMKVD